MELEHLGDLDVDGRLLKLILENRSWGYGLDAARSIQGTVAGSFKHDNEFPCSKYLH